jgi:hypothetical protein
VDRGAHEVTMRILFLFSFAGCAGLAQPAAKSPVDQGKPIPYAHQPDFADVSYGPHPRNVLDLWKAKSDQSSPLAIFYHPGGFGLGDKTWIPPAFLETCLKKGGFRLRRIAGLERVPVVGGGQRRSKTPSPGTIPPAKWGTSWKVATSPATITLASRAYSECTWARPSTAAITGTRMLN